MVKWSAAEDQQLLLVANMIHKFDCNRLAELWNESYAGDKGENKVTASAITQHLTKLRGKVGGPSAQSTPRKAVTAAPKTNTKLTSTPKTGSTRRKRNFDEQDDSEEEHIKATPTIKRESLGRSKKTPRKYSEPDTDEEANDENEIHTPNMFDVPNPFKNKEPAGNGFVERFKKGRDLAGSIDDDGDISSYEPAEAFTF